MKRALIVTLLLSGAPLIAQQLPAGPGADIVKSRCVVCHEADIITQQKLTLAGWTRSVDKMVRWGAAVTPDERKILEPYLAQHFAPQPVASHADAEASAKAAGLPAEASAKAAGLPAEASAKAGEGTFKRVCLACHEADMIQQQRLTPTGWTRSVEKMMRWGAAVSDADKQPLIDYLAAHYGPR